MPEEAKGGKQDSGSPTGDKGKEAASVKPKDSDEPEAQSEESDDSDDDDEGDDETLPEGDLHKSKRWKKVHGALKEYKKMGLSPLELQAALARLQQFETILAEEEKAASSKDDDEEETEEQKTLRKKRKAARKELLTNILPEAAELQEIKQRQELFMTSLERRAARALNKIATENNLPTDKKNIAALEEVLSTIIVNDEDLYYDYVSDPAGAVQSAFEQFSKGFKSAAERSVKADLQQKKLKLLGLPKTHKGGVPETKGSADKGPKNLNEARKRAEARLAAIEE